MRPSNSTKWPERICPILLDLNNCKIEYCQVDDRGLPTLRRRPLKGKFCTVIFGHHLAGEYLQITPREHVWTCKFNGIGHLSAVGTTLEGESIIGEDLTVIYEV